MDKKLLLSLYVALLITSGISHAAADDFLQAKSARYTLFNDPLLADFRSILYCETEDEVASHAMQTAKAEALFRRGFNIYHFIIAVTELSLLYPKPVILHTDPDTGEFIERTPGALNKTALGNSSKRYLLRRIQTTYNQNNYELHLKIAQSLALLKQASKKSKNKKTLLIIRTIMEIAKTSVFIRPIITEKFINDSLKLAPFKANKANYSSQKAQSPVQLMAACDTLLKFLIVNQLYCKENMHTFNLILKGKKAIHEFIEGMQTTHTGRF